MLKYPVRIMRAIGEAIKKIGSTYPLIGVCGLLEISPLIILSIRKALH